MLDRITSMQVFARVAALGSFSAAARALRMSPAMATKHVVAIEHHLGARLFHRTTRKLTLTEAGTRYRDAVDRILAEIDEAEAETTADVVEPRGTLRVNGPLAFGIREIAPALADFARLNPRVTIDLGLTDRYVDLVEEGWDLAVRIGQLRDSSLVARKLAPARAVLCASPEYLAIHGPPRTAADLARHNCLGYTLPTPAAAERWSFGPDATDSVPVSGTLRVNNGDALRVAALAGMGLIYQPTFILADDLRSGRLVCIHLDRPTVQFGNVYAVFAPTRRMPAKARLFIEFVADRWANVPPWDVGLPLD
jgi:DNA-binding transcriptional LysR family regulator